MTARAPVREWMRAIRSALRPLRPKSYWQVWLSVTVLPLTVLTVGLGLKMIFRTWPQFDAPAAIGTFSYIALVGARQSQALRRRRRALLSLTGADQRRAAD
jgi:hypothetical protein